MGRLDVDRMLEEVSAQDLQRWCAFFAVRHERDDAARRDAEDAANGFDGEEIAW